MSIFAELEKGVFTASAEETGRLARCLAAELPPDTVLALEGNLGAGKTTFVQGIAAAFGVIETVKSPSFNLVSIHAGSRQIVHIDAYRLESEDALEGLMIEEFLRSPYCLVLEWPENVASWLPPDALWLKITIEAGDRRRFQWQTR